MKLLLFVKMPSKKLSRALNRKCKAQQQYQFQRGKGNSKQKFFQPPEADCNVNVEVLKEDSGKDPVPLNSEHAGSSASDQKPSGIVLQYHTL